MKKTNHHKNTSSKTKIIRNIILATTLIGTIVLNYLHISKGNQYPSVHALCPTGGLENFWAFVGGHSNIQKIFSGTMTLFFLTIIFTLIFGRSFCGHICPFGALFEFIGKIKKKKIIISKNLDKYLRLLKYLILILITIMAWKTATLWISPYDPYTAFAHLSNGTELLSEMPIALILLILIVIASIYVDRFFCRYLCPAGALYALVSKISFLKIKRQPCLNCGTCSKVCPMGIDVKNLNEVKGGECIACGQCVDSCPDNNKYLGFHLLNKKIKTLTLILFSVFTFVISLFILDRLNLLRFSLPKIETIQVTKKYIPFSELKGSMSIELGAQYTGKDLTEFYKIMEIPQSISKETLLKEVSFQVPGYDFHVIKSKI